MDDKTKYEKPALHGTGDANGELSRQALGGVAGGRDPAEGVSCGTGDSAEGYMCNTGNNADGHCAKGNTADEACNDGSNTSSW